MLRYVRVMNADASPVPNEDDAVDLLRADLARGDHALAGVAPVLVQMLAGPAGTHISDQTMAQLRGMIDSLANQLLSALLGDDQNVDRAGPQHHEYGNKNCRVAPSF